MMTRSRWILLAVWAAFVVAMIRDGVLHPPPAELLSEGPGSDATGYGHNDPQHLPTALMASVLELIIGMWLLGARQQEQPLLRLGIGGAFLLPLSFFWMLASMHTGGVMLLHLLWILLLNLMWWGLIALQLLRPDRDQRQQLG